MVRSCVCVCGGGGGDSTLYPPLSSFDIGGFSDLAASRLPANIFKCPSNIRVNMECIRPQQILFHHEMPTRHQWIPPRAFGGCHV